MPFEYYPLNLISVFYTQSSIPLFVTNYNTYELNV